MTPKDPAAVELGRRGGKKGGRARAERLTAAERSEAARRAARARWGPSTSPGGQKMTKSALLGYLRARRDALRDELRDLRRERDTLVPRIGVLEDRVHSFTVVLRVYETGQLATLGSCRPVDSPPADADVP